MNITIKTNCTRQIVTCNHCHSTTAERGSSFCHDCNRELFPQDYGDQSADCAESPTYRRVDVDLYIEVIDREERGALRSDSQRDNR